MCTCVQLQILPGFHQHTHLYRDTQNSNGGTDFQKSCSSNVVSSLPHSLSSPSLKPLTGHNQPPTHPFPFLHSPSPPSSLAHTPPTPYLGAPEFDGPVEGGRDEEVGEVYGAHRAVTADACDGPLVALEHLTDTCLTGEV